MSELPDTVDDALSGDLNLGEMVGALVTLIFIALTFGAIWGIIGGIGWNLFAVPVFNLPHLELMETIGAGILLQALRRSFTL